jgi:hypothetical protein
MNIEEMGPLVESYLALNVVSADYADIKKAIPQGWHMIGKELENLSKLTDWTQFSLQLTQGLLRIYAQHSDPSAVSLWEMVSQQTARQTAIVCMICGKKSFRRKEEEGWPNLCREQYVLYANYRAEKEG